MKNKRNLFYKEAKTMQKLYKKIQKWQNKHKKRLLSIVINKDNNKYCCIGLSNPTEVTIVDSFGRYCAFDQALQIRDKTGW